MDPLTKLKQANRLPLELLGVLEQLKGDYLKDIEDIDSFAMGFALGRKFQHEQILRVLCEDCLAGHPLTDALGSIPTHDVPRGDGSIWRRTCRGRDLKAFEPR